MGIDRKDEKGALTSEPTMLDYERGLRDLMNQLTLEAMQEQLGGEGKDRRKKKIKATFGEASMDKAHPLCQQGRFGLAISPLPGWRAWLTVRKPTG